MAKAQHKAPSLKKRFNEAGSGNTAPREKQHVPIGERVTRARHGLGRFAVRAALGTGLVGGVGFAVDNGVAYENVPIYDAPRVHDMLQSQELAQGVAGLLVAGVSAYIMRRRKQSRKAKEQPDTTPTAEDAEAIEQNEDAENGNVPENEAPEAVAEGAVETADYDQGPWTAELAGETEVSGPQPFVDERGVIYMPVGTVADLQQSEQSQQQHLPLPPNFEIPS